MRRRGLSLWLLPALSGAVLPFCFAPYHLWWLAFPALWLLLQILRWGETRHALLQGWCFGLGFFGVGVSWVYVSIHDHGNAPPALAAALTALFVAGIALFPAAQFALTARLTTRGRTITNSLTMAALWVLFEWVRSWLFTGFPWLYLGNSLIDTPLAGWAPVTGVYGVSLALLLSSAVLFILWRCRRPVIWAAALSTLILLWGGGALLKSTEWTVPTRDTIKVSFVQANIAQEEKWIPGNRGKITDQYLSLTESLWDSDLIIWPETALPYFLHQAARLTDTLDRKARETQTALAMGVLSATFGPVGDASIYNSFTILGEGSGLYHKQKLVPFGEYVPLESQLRGLIEFFNLPMSDMSLGQADQSPLRFREISIMPLICYEVVYPDFVAGYAAQADLLITVSNDSWFGDSIGPHQHLQIARMRAAETRKYVLRGTNNGLTAVIDPFGRLTAEAPQFERTTLSAEASARQGNTPFVTTGSWPVLALCLLLVAVGSYRKFRP